MRDIKVAKDIKRKPLKGKTLKVINLLKINPTTKYVVKETGYHKSIASTIIGRLIKKSYVKRIGRAKYYVYKSGEIKEQEIENKEAKKKVISDRYNKVCYFCDYDEVVDKHHIIPRSKHGSNHLSNLIGLCRNCHGKIHIINYHLIYEKGFYYMKGGKKNMNPSYYQLTMPRPPSIDSPKQNLEYDESE